jgi:chemotaxis protein histidine kinase CheA
MTEHEQVLCVMRGGLRARHIENPLSGYDVEADAIDAVLADLEQAERERDEARFRHDKQEQRAEAAEAKVAELTAALEAEVEWSDDPDRPESIRENSDAILARAKAAQPAQESQAQPDDPPPEGYLAWHEWARYQHRAGLRQRRCPVCCLWKFPQEKCNHTTRPDKPEPA